MSYWPALPALHVRARVRWLWCGDAAPTFGEKLLTISTWGDVVEKADFRQVLNEILVFQLESGMSVADI